MLEKISDGALAHVKTLMDREREIENAINAWTMERVKIQYAKEKFLEFLNLEHGLADHDIVDPGTGAITRVEPLTTTDATTEGETHE